LESWSWRAGAGELELESWSWSWRAGAEISLASPWQLDDGGIRMTAEAG